MNSIIWLKDATEDMRYVVVKSSTHTLIIGDHVRIDPRDRSLVCREAEGWLDENDWKEYEEKVKVEIDERYYSRALQISLDEITKIAELAPEPKVLTEEENRDGNQD